MFSRPEAGERAILVHLALNTVREDLYELKELAKSAGASSVHTISGSRQHPDPKYFIGSGKLAQLKSALAEYQADLVLVNHSLSPSQERNLEQALDVRVVDRNRLILDIFALRAQTFEGKLQVELAQLKHLSTRLIRGWSHLERQKGGIGMRGPGEAQLETDRRLLNARIKLIQRRLQKVAKQRSQGRSKRKKAKIPSVSLVGYTNAGKSTLFNRLTGAASYVADQLFATLDPTLRNCQLTRGSEIVLADTVGFIRQLPHELVAAFKSTLQEASEADLLLHVIAANAEHKEATIVQVEQVLKSIDASEIQSLQVFNKIDLLDGVEPRIDRNSDGTPIRVWLSATTGAGVDLLVQALAEIFSSSKVQRKCFLQPHQGNIRSSLFDYAKIMDEKVTELGGWNLSIEIDKKYLGLLRAVKTEEIKN